MKGFGLTLTLIDDCVLSQRSATEGGHAGLDYVPGATLLGAAAGRLYGELSSTDAFTLFHSGRVRFGNGLPVTTLGETACPMPLSWHAAKGESAESDGCLDANRIWNPGLRNSIPADEQPQQLRTGYVTASGALVKPHKSLRLKTAINPENGRAREGALFGYDALCAGQTFRSVIDVDENVADSLLEKLKKALRASEVVLGRSRSAEYGRAECRVHDDVSRPEPGGAAGKTITLWLLSDLAAIDDLGQPTLAPKPQWLSLPDGKLLFGKSFLRSRRYSPWNAKRGGPDLERQVISQGSVLVFELDRALDTNESALIAAGIGLHREAGLGQVWLNPPLLARDQPVFGQRAAPARPDTAPRPPSDLLAWLDGRREAASARAGFAQRARDLSGTYAELMRSGRRLKGLDRRAEIGPSHSQWGNVLATAKNSRRERFAADLKEVCKECAPGWSDEHWDEQGGARRFAAWFWAVVGDNPDPELVRHLAREVMDVVKKESRR
jgi:CRISPR-associated protein Csx10